VTVLAMTGLLLLRPTKRGTDERGSTSEFHSDDPLDLGQQLLVGDGSSTLEIGDLARQLRESLQKTPSWGFRRNVTGTDRLTSCGLALTAVARSF
jgi:hypothetical protein